jgi:hypothetical protein
VLDAAGGMQHPAPDQAPVAGSITTAAHPCRKALPATIVHRVLQRV